MRRAVLLLPLLLLAACNDDAPSLPGSGGAGATTGSSAAGFPDGGGPGATAGSGANGGAGGSSASGGAGRGACDVLQAEPSLGAVTFRVKNDGDLPVYLATGECTYTFSVTAPGIDTETAELIGVACEYVTPAYRGGFPLDCDTIASPITVPPGQERTFEWSGLLRETTDIPDGCGPPDTFGDYCERARAAPAGPLTVHFPRYQAVAIDEIEGTDYPTDPLRPAEAEFTHPTAEVLVDASLYSN